MYEIFRNILWVISILISFVTAIFAILVVYNLKKQTHKEGGLKGTLVRVFVLISLGSIFLAAYMVIYSIIVPFSGVDPNISLLNIFNQLVLAKIIWQEN